jgi:hypothetical protein
MNKIHYVMLLLLFFTLPHAVAQEELQEGMWPGSIKLSGKDEAPARVHVIKQTESDEHAKTTITMYVEDTPLEFINLDIRKDSLHFDLDTGTMSTCVMKKQESGGYQGYCEVGKAKDDKERIELSMRPPKASDND